MFAPIEDILDLSTGITYNQVVNKMGMKPYDLFINQRTGSKIYIYYYKNIERKVGPKAYNKRGHEQEGRERYNRQLKTCFIVFDSIGKLETITTTRGKIGSDDLLMLNNTVYILSKNKKKSYLTPLLMKDYEIGEVKMTHKKRKKIQL